MNRRIRICLSSQLYWRNLRYQSINNVTPGPASTGLLYDIVLVKLGVLPSVLAFLIWRYNTTPLDMVSLTQVYPERLECSAWRWGLGTFNHNCRTSFTRC